MSSATATILAETQVRPVLGNVFPLFATKQSSDPLVPIFCTGTFRIGRADHLWIQEAVRYAEPGATASGALFWPEDHKSEVTVARYDKPGRIVGDLLWFDPGHFCYEILMNAFPPEDFSLIEIVVQTEHGAEECHAFHYNRPPKGWRVPGGDWPV